MTLKLQELLDAMFLPAGERVAAGEVIAVDNGKGTLLLEVRGPGIPDQGEVKAVFQRQQPIRVEFQPVERDPLRSEGWPSWGPP